MLFKRAQNIRALFFWNYAPGAFYSSVKDLGRLEEDWFESMLSVSDQNQNETKAILQVREETRKKSTISASRHVESVNKAFETPGRQRERATHTPHYGGFVLVEVRAPCRPRWIRRSQHPDANRKGNRPSLSPRASRRSDPGAPPGSGDLGEGQRGPWRGAGGRRHLPLPCCSPARSALGR